MTKTAIAIRHVYFEDLGAFDEVLRRHGYDLRYCDVGIDNVGEIDPLAPDLIVVLGGPISAYQELIYPFLGEEVALLEHRLTAARPTLGICLGAQLMARALGARVYPAPAKEVGWAELQLSEAGRTGALRHLTGVPVLHWHGDTFDLLHASSFLPRPRSAQIRRSALVATRSLANSIGDYPSRFRALARRTCRRACCRTRCFARSAAARYRTPLVGVGVARRGGSVRVGRRAR